MPLEIISENLNTLIEEIYFDFLNNYTEIGYLSERSILCSTHAYVNQINLALLEKIPEREVEYFSADSIARPDETNSNLFSVDYLNTLSIQGLPEHILKLKVGAAIMLTTNMDPKSGLCNGTRLRLDVLSPKVLLGTILGGLQNFIKGQFKGNSVMIPRMNFISKTSLELPFELKRRQFAVKLCFAMTINKSQGQTIDFPGIYLPEHVFTHGQLYVALSRTSSSNNIRVLLGIENNFNTKTKNIVFREILED